MWYAVTVPQRFAQLTFSPAVRSAQERYGSTAVADRLLSTPDELDRIGPDEAAFITARDGFHLATVGSAGWPYVQFRGGPPGFLRVLDEHTIAWADFRGNRQYITAGNLDPDGGARVAMILMDLAAPRRIKLLGTARVVDVDDDPALATSLTVPGYPGRIERSVVVDVAALSWNCPKHITARFTTDEVRSVVDPLQQEIARLHEENAQLRLAAHAPSDDGR